MYESCNIFGKCRDRNTGKLTSKISLLHRDLLGLGKIQSLFTRLKANRAFYLSQNPKFLKKYDESLIFTSEDADAEPNLASFYEAAHAVMPEVKLSDIRELLAKKFKEGVYSYEEAERKVVAFNQQKDGGTSFIGTLVPQPNGKYLFKIAYNTTDELRSLMQVIADRKNADTILGKLESLGVGLIEGARAMYNTKGPKVLSNGILGIITLKEGAKATGYNIKDLATETGHLIVGMLGPDNTFYRRLLNAVESHPEIAKELLGDEEASSLDSRAKTNAKDRKTITKELMGHLVGLYLELWENIKPNSALKTFGTLLLRAIDWIYSHIRFNNRDYNIALYNAKWTAYTMVKDFMGSNFLGDLLTALNTEETLYASNSISENVLSKMLESIRQLDQLRERYKGDLPLLLKNYSDIIKYLVGKYHNLIKIDMSSEGDNSGTFKEFQGEVAATLLDMTRFISLEINNSKMLLSLILKGVDNEGNPISIKEQALAIRYCESVYAMANIIKGYLQDFEIGLNAESRDTRDVKIEFEILHNELQSFDYLQGNTTPNSEVKIKSVGLNEAIRLAKRALALKLIVLMNGHSFIAINDYVYSEGLKLVRTKDKKDFKKLWSASDILKETVIGSVFDSYISSMADNPQKLNTLIYNYVEEQKHKANLDTLNTKDELFALLHELREDVKINDTRILYEVDSKGHLTGNLVSERNWGEWEAKYQKEKEDFDEEWYNNNRFIRDTFGHPTDRAWLTNRHEMYYNNEYLLAFSVWREKWHNANSTLVPVLDSNGIPVKTYKGRDKKVYAPAITSDLGSTGKNTYDSKQWEDIKNNAKLLAWYNKYMKLKAKLDEQLPDGSTNALGVRAPQFMGNTTNNLKNAFKGSGMVLRVLGMPLRLFAINTVAASPSDTEYGGENNTYKLEDLKDKEGVIFDRAHFNLLNSMERAPIYGVRKLKNLDDLSTDLILATLAYAAMSHSYNCLSAVLHLCLLLNSAAIDTKTSVGLDSAATNEVISNTQLPRLGDYIAMQICNNYRSTKIPPEFLRPVRKGTKLIAKTGSLYMLGWNVHSAITNLCTAFIEIMKEAHGGVEFKKRHFFFATLIYMRGVGESLMEKALNLGGLSSRNQGSSLETHSKLSLFSRMYDVQNENQREFRNYYVLTRGWDLFNGFSYMNAAMLPYEITDHCMLSMAFIASAVSTTLKNKDTGETTSLWKAYEVVTENGLKKLKLKGGDDKWLIVDKQLEKINNAILLKVKDTNNSTEYLSPEEVKEAFETEVVNGITQIKIDADGERVVKSTWVPFDLKLLNLFRLRCRGVNNRLHGVYNTGDGGAYEKFAIACVLSSMKRYAIGMIDNRFSSARYDARTGEVRQGRVVTMWNIALDCFDSYATGDTNKLVLKLDALKYSDYAYFGTIGKILWGAAKFLYITLGPSNYKIGVDKYLKSRGFSDYLIDNVRKFWGDMAAKVFLEFIMELTAPEPLDEPEEDDSIWGFLVNECKKVTDPIFNNNFVKFSEEVLLSIYTTVLNLLPFDFTVDDEQLLDKDYIRANVLRSVKTEEEIAPFSIKGIIYYQAYRTLLEQKAYNIWSPQSIWLEWNSLISTALPGAVAIVDLITAISMVCENVSEEDLEKLPINELDNFYNGKRIYVKGPNRGWYKSTKKVLKSFPLPFRSGETYLNGYLSQHNMEHFKEPWKAAGEGVSPVGIR